MNHVRTLVQADQIRIALACLSRARKLLKDAGVSARKVKKAERHIKGVLSR